MMISLGSDLVQALFIVGLALYGLSQVVEQLKAWLSKKPETPPSSGDYLLYKSKLIQLDVDMFKAVKETSDSYTKELIRGMITDEIAFRVSAHALNPEILKLRDLPTGSSARGAFEVELNRQQKIDDERKSRTEALKAFLREHRISDSWFMSSGMFKASLPELPSVSEVKLDPELHFDLFFHSLEARADIQRECVTTHKHHRFGNAIPCASIDELSDKDLDMILKFKDKLLEFFKQSQNVSRRLPEGAEEAEQ